MLILFIIIIILFILWSYKKLSNKISKYYISRNSFNNIFNSNIIILPESITAFGFDNNKYYIYNQYGIFSDQLSQKRINTFLDYWIKYIHPFILKKKYYFLLCSFDGYRERILFNNTLQKEYIKNKYKFLFHREITNVDNKMPIMHKNEYVFCFSKHLNDSLAVTIPDLFYIKQYSNNNY